MVSEFDSGKYNIVSNIIALCMEQLNDKSTDKKEQDEIIKQLDKLIGDTNYNMLHTRALLTNWNNE